MRDFKYFRPQTMDDAVSILQEFNGRAKALAGGTDLYGGLKDEIHALGPKALVDLKARRDSAHIRSEGNAIRIGALTRLKDIEQNPMIRQKAPLLSQAAVSVASPQIRNRATVGGNICQEPRCWYYRNPDNRFACHRKGGSRCNALLGDNRFHSVFGAARVVDTACTTACPAHTAIPEYLEKIRSGDIFRAADILLNYNPMPAVTGRVCPHFCQSECNRSFLDSAVSVRHIERFVGDTILEHASRFFKPPAQTGGKKIAVIGSGPGGLSAAYFLCRAGHCVTVFDQAARAGGMLTHAIPPYRLERSVVENTVAAIAATGVTFRMNTRIGENLSLDAVRKDHDAVLLATGAGLAVSIGLPGENLALSGLDYLRHFEAKEHRMTGKQVLVIGGGNVAVDVAVTALGQGAAKVTLACLEERRQMPCHDWEINEALEEGVVLLTGRGPSRLEKKGDHRIHTQLVRCTAVYDGQNRFAPRFDPADATKLTADRVILAVGQKPDLSFIGPDSRVVGKEGRIRVDPETQSTGMDGVYACGDAVSRPATVIEAIASGRRAAAAIDRDLMGRPSGIEPQAPDGRDLLPVMPDSLSRSGAPPAHEFDHTGVRNASQRCLNCGCVAVSPTDMGPALMAMGAEVVTTQRVVPISDFFRAGLMGSTLLDPHELVVELKVPVPDRNTYQVYLKHRLRNAIDFPIVSVAAFICARQNRISTARIVLGAVAPVPLRARPAEEMILDSGLGGPLIDKACDAAVKHASPLSMNGYKIQIIKALLRRALIDARTKLL